MGRTVAIPFFHPYEVRKREKYLKGKLKNWIDSNAPFYYDNIPIYLNKIYKKIDVQLEEECHSKIPEKQCLPQIVVLDEYLEELKNHIRQSPIYESVNYGINYEKELPELLNLVKSHKYFMYYLHIPKETSGYWFCEGRFFTLEEIEKTKDETIYKKIDNFVREKKIDYMDFLEEWVGLIFHLAAEFLLFKMKLKSIFYSCDECYRPGIFIKGEIKKEEDDSQKIWGTINIVDTIIYNCMTNLNFSNISKDKQRSKNNIIYHDELFADRTKDWEIFQNETDGAFILTYNESIWNNLIEEIKGKKYEIEGKDFDYKFDLIIVDKQTEENDKEISIPKKILKKIEELEADKYIDRICIYSYSSINYNEIKNKYQKIENNIFNTSNDIIKFIHFKKQDSEIYPTIKLITYEEYSNKYQVLHQLISEKYGQNKDNCFKVAISYLKDFLLWNPKLKLETSKDKSKIESMLEILQKFKGINDNEEDIITLYTQESNSYYKDFNYWLNTSDPLAIQKTSWFIAAVIYSLNKYAKKKKKGLKENIELYRGIKANIIDLLNYERAKGKLICFPSFTSTSGEFKVASAFSKDNKGPNQYETIITINYIYKKGFIPTAVDVSKIAVPEHEYEKEYIFPPYTFFIVKNVAIDHLKKIAEIEIDTVGKKEIIEKNMEKGSNLIYNKEEGFMELTPSIPRVENSGCLNCWYNDDSF